LIVIEAIIVSHRFQVPRAFLPVLKTASIPARPHPGQLVDQA
jgi:hypothetical protein